MYRSITPTTKMRSEPDITAPKLAECDFNHKKAQKKPYLIEMLTSLAYPNRPQMNQRI